MAAAKAGADVLGAPLYQHLGGAFRGDEFPTPLGNIIGGGEHAADATRSEFLAAAVGAPSVDEADFATPRSIRRSTTSGRPRPASGQGRRGSLGTVRFGRRSVRDRRRGC